jgi:hypothetical protein
MRKYHNKDLVVVREIEKFFSKVAAVAVKNKESITCPRFVFCEPIKDLFNPRQPEVIVIPSTRRCARKTPVFSWINVVYPATAKISLSCKDHSWIYLAPISTYTCQNCYPLLVAILQARCLLLFLKKRL